MQDLQTRLDLADRLLSLLERTKSHPEAAALVATLLPEIGPQKPAQTPPEARRRLTPDEQADAEAEAVVKAMRREQEQAQKQREQASQPPPSYGTTGKAHAARWLARYLA